MCPHGEEETGHVLILSHRTLPDASGLQVKTAEDRAVQLSSRSTLVAGGVVRGTVRPQDALVALQGRLPCVVRVGLACGHLSAMRYPSAVVKMMSFDIRAEFMSFPLCASCVNLGRLFNLSEH